MFGSRGKARKRLRNFDCFLYNGFLCNFVPSLILKGNCMESKFRLFFRSFSETKLRINGSVWMLLPVGHVFRFWSCDVVYAGCVFRLRRNLGTVHFGS